MVYYRVLSIAPCATQWGLVFLFHTWQFAFADPKLPLYPLPLGNHRSVLYVCEIVLYLIYCFTYEVLSLKSVPWEKVQNSTVSVFFFVVYRVSLAVRIFQASV